MPRRFRPNWPDAPWPPRSGGGQAPGGRSAWPPPRVAGLLLVGSNSSMVADTVERILGTGIRNMTQQEYAQRVSGDWPADMPMPEYYSPEETAQLRDLPVAQPGLGPGRVYASERAGGRL